MPQDAELQMRLALASASGRARGVARYLREFVNHVDDLENASEAGLLALASVLEADSEEFAKAAGIIPEWSDMNSDAALVRRLHEDRA